MQIPPQRLSSHNEANEFWRGGSGGGGDMDVDPTGVVAKDENEWAWQGGAPASEL